MMFAIAGAELRYQLRSLRALATFATVFGFTFLLTANAGEFQSFAPGGTVLANAPFAITETLIKISVFAIFAVPAFLGDAVLRDVDHRFDSILFATPVTKRDYLAGRFAGAFAALMVALSGAPLGMLLGTFWPWADTELLGPTHLGHYASVFFGIMLPSMLAISAIVFAVAVISRGLLQTYVTVLALLVLYLVTGSLDSFPPLLDPFLFEVLDAQTRYWTAGERNTQLLAFEGAVLGSRLLWTGLAGVFFLLAYTRFSFRQQARKAPPADTTRQKNRALPVIVDQDRGTPVWGQATRLRQLLVRTRFEIVAVAKSAPFVIVMALSLFLLSVELMSREVMYGVQALPLTRLMLPDAFPVVPAVMVILVFYSADVVWRERTHGIHQILDAMPASNSVFVASKLGALMLIVAGIFALGIVLAVLLQISDGYWDFELGLYFERGLVYPLLSFFCLAILTCFFQVLARGRYLGMMLFGLFLAVIVASRDIFQLEHPLASFVFPPPAAPLSDMNGTGHFMALGYWVRAYWGSIAGLMLVLTYLLFPRGTLQPLRYRLRALKALRSSGFAVPTLLLILSLLGSAGFILFNTNWVNEYHSQAEVEALQAAYEKRFRPSGSLPMPRIVEVRLEADLFPHRRRVEARSTHVLENDTDQVLSTVHVVFPPGLDVLDITLEDGTQTLLDETLVPYYVFELTTPMAPGERRELDFEVRMERKGFTHDRPDTRLVHNGTFFTNGRLAPTIGFEHDYMIEDPKTRQEHGLPPLPRRPRLEDTHEHGHNVTRRDSDFVRFEATLSTRAEQTAITLGRLEREWVEGDRRFFHYRMEAPTRNLYPILSAEYSVARDRWNDVDIEVFHHPTHSRNVERMIEAIRDSLEVYGEAFGPYPFTHVRIAEFPAYHPYAQAFAGTIPFSEAMGFVADVKPGDIDMPYYVTAHEMAHMWWGHVVSAANTQGDGFIHETLAQYSALRVMERKVGEEKIRRFLKYELDRYLAGRADDPEGELPLYRVEKQQYIHYRKGSLVMYALRDYLGTEVVDRSLRRLVDLRGFSSEPYATSTDFLAILKEEAGPEHHGLIEDLFERITLYDLELVEGEVEELPDGRFEVRIEVEATKLYAQGDGTESRAPFDLPVDIGLFAESPADDAFTADDVIYLEKMRVDDGRSTLTLRVDRRPEVVGIDPYNKLIDRDSEDNLGATHQGS